MASRREKRLRREAMQWAVMAQMAERRKATPKGRVKGRRGESAASSLDAGLYAAAGRWLDKNRDALAAEMPVANPHSAETVRAEVVQ